MGILSVQTPTLKLLFIFKTTTPTVKFFGEFFENKRVIIFMFIRKQVVEMFAKIEKDKNTMRNKRGQFVKGHKPLKRPK